MSPKGHSPQAHKMRQFSSLPACRLSPGDGVRALPCNRGKGEAVLFCAADNRTGLKFTTVTVGPGSWVSGTGRSKTGLSSLPILHAGRAGLTALGTATPAQLSPSGANAAPAKGRKTILECRCRGRKPPMAEFDIALFLGDPLRNPGRGEQTVWVKDQRRRLSHVAAPGPAGRPLQWT